MHASPLTMGVIGTSRKENELRAPIHPHHVDRIDPALRARIRLERGYGERFGTSDATLAEAFGGLLSREEIFEQCDIVLLPKPTDADLPSFRRGQILWGWPHCVQGPAITQAAIDERLTCIAWEEMQIWRGGVWQVHVFHKNNELAGYCSVLHALQLAGTTGLYGPPLRVAVIGFGSVGRGAVHGLRAMGLRDVTLFTPDREETLRGPMPGLRHRLFERSTAGRSETRAQGPDGAFVPMAEALGAFDVIVNCILQDPVAPLLYVSDAEARRLRPGALIVDVSCDAGMGFEFARPTSFEAPTFQAADGRVLYYAVDHSLSLMWNSATWVISEALLPHIPTVMAGPAAWDAAPTISRAIEIREGVIQNPRILEFQGRSGEYPHPRRSG